LPRDVLLDGDNNAGTNVRSLFYFVDIHLKCSSRSRHRHAVQLYLLVSIYFPLLI